MTTLTWVVGAGGLLGRHVSAAARGRSSLFSGPPIPWGDPALAQRTLRETAHLFVTEAAASYDTWRVYWCAGAGVTNTGADALNDEFDAFDSALTGLSSGKKTSSGTVFLASSVGGIYAGAVQPPFTEQSEPAPLAPYGRAKLKMERHAHHWAEQTGVTVAVGRISNLYGAGQNLAKLQGLLSQICANYVRRRPSSIWVPLDTIRDYIYVDDCAELVVDFADRAANTRTSTTKILASGQGIPISGVLGEFRRVLGKRPEILIGSSPSAAYQALDLSVRSQVWPELDERPTTPLSVGMSRTIASIQMDWSERGTPPAS